MMKGYFRIEVSDLECYLVESVHEHPEGLAFALPNVNEGDRNQMIRPTRGELSGKQIYKGFERIN